MSRIFYTFTGAGLKMSTLKNMLSNSYSRKNNNIDGYEVDKQLSGERVQVHHNPTTNHTVVTHRGTASANDWITNARLLLGDKNSERFKHSKRISEEAHKKYEGSQFTQIGHSLGSELARESNKKHNDETLTLNRAFTPKMLMEKQKDNEHHIRSQYDPISILQNITPNHKNNITIKNNDRNLLNQHKTDTLEKTDIDYVGDKNAV